MARRLAREEGIFGGGSAGSAVAGMLKYVKAKKLGADAVCVVIIPDSGSRYVTKFYSDEWMEENGYLEAAESVGRMLDSKSAPGGILSVARADTLRRALDTMAQHGVSQLPVVDESGACVGALREEVVTARVLERPALLTEPVSAVMETPLPVVESTAPQSSVVALLRDHPAVLVRREGKLAGILSRYDLLAHLAKR